jgi:hypothetical protein
MMKTCLQETGHSESDASASQRKLSFVQHKETAIFGKVKRVVVRSLSDTRVAPPGHWVHAHEPADAEKRPAAQLVQPLDVFVSENCPGLQMERTPKLQAQPTPQGMQLVPSLKVPLAHTWQAFDPAGKTPSPPGQVDVHAPEATVLTSPLPACRKAQNHSNTF